MSSNDLDASKSNVDSPDKSTAPKTHPAPSMLWLLLPVALLALLAFVSR